MDEKIKIAITKQDNESEKKENTDKKRFKKKKNKNWDDMAQSMQDFIISLKQNSDSFLPEDSYKKLEMYKKTYDRLLYTVLSDEIFSCFDDETKIKEGTNILTNIDALLVYCENNENYQKDNCIILYALGNTGFQGFLFFRNRLKSFEIVCVIYK